MKTKIIDILDMIARGQEPPKQIVFRNEVYEYDAKEGDYWNNSYTDAIFDYYEITDILNEEVQILEINMIYSQDSKQDKIEPFKEEVNITEFAAKYPEVAKVLKSHEKKIAKLIEVVNKDD